MRLRKLNGLRLVGVFCLTLTAVVLVGCSSGMNPEHGFMDPTQVGAWSGKPLVKPILDHLTVFEEASVDFGAAVPAQQEDLVASRSDYVIGRSDLLTISIPGLVSPDVETIKQVRVSETGNISLPLIGVIKVIGLTESEAEKAIGDSYVRGGFLARAQVSVTVVEARARTFSILGQVAAPGEYVIVRSDFRLLDALVLARDVTNPSIDDIYIIRKIDEQGRPAGAAPGTTRPAGDVLAPRSDATRITTPKLLQTAAPATRPTEERPVTIDGRTVVIGANNGTRPPTTVPAPAAQGRFEFAPLSAPSDMKIIRVPLKALRGGALAHNLVIRPGDMILVPTPAAGVYYMGGNIQVPGAYSLTGQKMTLKQAVWAARGLGPLAIPSKCEVVRRLPDDKEVFVRVDLEKIFAGQQEDVYVRPDDVINVGTNALAPFIAAIRGGFRLTYGFGWVYDRNYAAQDNNVTN